MKKIICLFAREMTKDQESLILKLDSENAEIHVFDNVLEHMLSAGFVWKLIEELYPEAEDALILVSDDKTFLHTIRDVFGNLFEDLILCGESQSSFVEPEAYQQLRTFGDEDRKNFLLLVIEFQKIKEELFQIGLEKNNLLYQAYFISEETRFSKNMELFMGNIKTVFSQFLEEYIDTLTMNDASFLVFALSFLLKGTFHVKYVEKICNIIYDESFTKDNRLFVFNQLKRFYLLNAGIMHSQRVQQLYDDVVREWKVSLKELLTPITAQKRNRKKVVVITLQMLGKNHAPTKSALERIYTIGKQLEHEIICINTREQYTLKGFLPFFDPVTRSVAEEYNGVNNFEHKDYRFVLIQPEIEMPDARMITLLLEEIRTLAPWTVVVIGDRCLLGDLCAEIIPTVCIPMTFSTIPKKDNQFVAVGRKIPDAERERMKRDGYCLSSIIESTFTFELTPQVTALTRKELGLPEDKFLLAVIGIRLDAEVEMPFLECLLETVSYGTHIVFAGTFLKYNQYCSENKKLKEHSTFVGYQKDILAFLENCDLYINPPRVGGGFSAAEAFVKGIPGISLSYGDVAAVVGEEFCVEKVEEYSKLIIRYIQDEKFYQEMSIKACKQSEKLFHSKEEMQKILQEMEKRELWF